MPDVILPFPEKGNNDKETIRNLTDTVVKLRKELEFLLQNLDEQNVIRAQTAIISDLLAGTITADQIDVTEGKIQSAQIESLIVGSNVVMGPDATISYSKVTGTPYIPTLPSYIHSTYIDQTNVMSPNISGGVITGALIRTNIADYTRIEMTAAGLISYDNLNRKDGVSLSSGNLKAVSFFEAGTYMGELNYDGLGNLRLYASAGCKIILSPVVYIGDTNAGNQIATQSWVSSQISSAGYATMTDVYSALASWMSSHVQQYHP